jgi:hypothetical protein
MSSSDKRKHKTLSAKAEIIKNLDKDEKFTNLAEESGVGHDTISGKIEKVVFQQSVVFGNPWSHIYRITKIVLYVLRKCGKVQIFGNCSKKSKFLSEDIKKR